MNLKALGNKINHVYTQIKTLNGLFVDSEEKAQARYEQKNKLDETAHNSILAKTDEHIEATKKASDAVQKSVENTSKAITDKVAELISKEYPEVPESYFKSISKTIEKELNKTLKVEVTNHQKINNQKVHGTVSVGNPITLANAIGKAVNDKLKIDFPAFPEIPEYPDEITVKQDKEQFEKIDNRLADLFGATQKNDSYTFTAGAQFDYIGIANNSSTQDTLTYKNGGASGTTVRTLVITYAAGASKISDDITSLDYS